jgi:hypothetical protein
MDEICLAGCLVDVGDGGFLFDESIAGKESGDEVGFCNCAWQMSTGAVRNHETAPATSSPIA